MRIIDTDNFGGDYPDEKFLSLTDSKGVSRPLYLDPLDAQQVCQALNGRWGEFASRYYRIVDNDYTLQPGFEP